MDSVSESEKENMQRNRKQTDQGQTYRLERMESHYKAFIAAWKRKSLKGGNIITDATNPYSFSSGPR